MKKYGLVLCALLGFSSSVWAWTWPWELPARKEKELKPLKEPPPLEVKEDPELKAAEVLLDTAAKALSQLNETVLAESKARGKMVDDYVDSVYKEWRDRDESNFENDKRLFDRFKVHSPLESIVDRAIFQNHEPYVGHLEWAFKNGFDVKKFSPLKYKDCDVPQALGARMLGITDSTELTVRDAPKKTALQVVEDRKIEYAQNSYSRREQEKCEISKKILKSSVEQLLSLEYLRKIGVDRDIEEKHVKAWAQWLATDTGKKQHSAQTAR